VKTDAAKDVSKDVSKDTFIRRRVIVNTASNYVAKILTLGVWFFLTPFLLRQLGANDYGLWILIGSIAAYGSLLDFGIGTAVTKYVAQFQAEGRIEQAQSLVATALWLYLGLGLVAVLLSAILAPFIPIALNIPAGQQSTASWLMLLSGLGLGVSLPSATSIAVLRGLHRFDLSNLVGIFGMTLFTVATISVVLLGGGLLGMVAVGIPVTLVTQVPAIWLIRRTAPKLRFGLRQTDRGLLRTLMSFSSALFVINVAGQVQTKTDEITIGAFMPVANVAPYSIARRLSEMPQLLTEQFMKVILPLASQLDAENDRGRLRTLYLASSRLTLAIFLPLAVGVIIFARPFLKAWVGAPYDRYAYLVVILTLASLLDTSQWPAGAILQGIGRHRLLAIIALGTAIANLGLSLALVHPLGLAGVALGTLIPATIESLCFVQPYIMRVNRIGFGVVFKEIYLPALLPAAPMAIVLYGLREIVQPVSVIAIAAIGGLGLLVYAIGYMTIGAGRVERQLGRDVWLGALRFTRRRLERARSDS
jgi:O-antigen/teichoic acid export membrane protein